MKETKLVQYKHLLGKDKKQIVEELGQEFNFYPEEVWTYVLKKSRWGWKTILFISFKCEKVTDIEIRKWFARN